MNKNDNNVFTSSQMIEHKLKLHDLFIEYPKNIPEHLSSNSTQNYKVVKQRLEIFDVLFKKFCETNKIDLGEKRKNISVNDRNMALLNSNGLCPICGMKLTDENTQIDHVNPKSKCSSTNYVAICASCNNRKNNLTKEEVDRYSAYIDKNTDQVQLLETVKVESKEDKKDVKKEDLFSVL
jgi:transcription elongation factor Elf1